VFLALTRRQVLSASCAIAAIHADFFESRPSSSFVFLALTRRQPVLLQALAVVDWMRTEQQTAFEPILVVD
jgi:hypothetical protein